MKELLTCLRLVGLSMLICCVAYPGLLWALAQVVAPWQAEGSLLTDAQGRTVGSAQIAQGFTQPEYFWPRPSAVDYDASATGGSNLSPKSPQLTERAQNLLARYNVSPAAPLPADLVAASGSGVDPHITLAAARYQVPRVAAARGLPLHQIEALIAASSEAGGLRIFGGEELVNVLRLNLVLDAVPVSRP